MKVSGWKKYSKQTDIKKKKAEGEVFISDKIDLKKKKKAIIEDKKGHYIILTGVVQQRI